MFNGMSTRLGLFYDVSFGITFVVGYNILSALLLFCLYSPIEYK